MSRVCQKVPTAFPRYQDPQSSQQIARAVLSFAKRESSISIGRRGAARPVTGGDAAPVPNGGGATRPLVDDAAEAPVDGGGSATSAAEAAGPVGAARPVAARPLDIKVPIADDNAERPEARGGAGGVGPNTEGSPEGVGNRDNAAKDSQTGQPVPLQGGINGATRPRMVA